MHCLFSSSVLGKTASTEGSESSLSPQLSSPKVPLQGCRNMDCEAPLEGCVTVPTIITIAGCSWKKNCTATEIKVMVKAILHVYKWLKIEVLWLMHILVSFVSSVCRNTAGKPLKYMISSTVSVVFLLRFLFSIILKLDTELWFCTRPFPCWFGFAFVVCFPFLLYFILV